jgi:hypothetical protein
MDNLVLAMAGGYDAATLRPFLRSLRQAGCGAQVVLFLHRNPPGTAEALRAEGAQTIEVDLPDVPETFSYNIARYPLFAAHLASSEASRVLLTDCRDVIFQRDPFAAISGTGIHLFEEHPARPVGNCIWTSSWIRYRYGDAALPPVADRPVICSGVVLGDTSPVRGYLARVVAELTPPLRATNYMAGYDQGVVNVLCRKGEIAHLVRHPYRSAQALHLGNAPAGTVRQDASGEVVNDAGEVVAIVHQHDRHPELRGLP